MKYFYILNQPKTPLGMISPLSRYGKSLAWGILIQGFWNLWSLFGTFILIIPCCCMKCQKLMEWKRRFLFLLSRKESAAWGTVSLKGFFPKSRRAGVPAVATGDQQCLRSPGMQVQSPTCHSGLRICCCYSCRHRSKMWSIWSLVWKLHVPQGIMEENIQ